jgi:hypothetical protein
MKLWNKFILWLGIAQFDQEENNLEEEKFRINERKESNIWTKNKYKIH